MKIMFSIQSMYKGGAERVVANLSNEFIKNYEVVIMTTNYGTSQYILNENIKYLSIDEKDTDKKNFIVKNISRLKIMNKIIKNENPDVIITFLPEPSIRMMLLNLFIKKKVIVSVRNDPKIEYKSFIRRIIAKVLYKKASGMIFQTEEAKSFFPKKIQNISKVIPNPINPEFIRSSYLGVRNKVIVSVGRLTKQKNQALLIEAFEIFSKNNPEYILKIYGNGELYDYLRQLIELKNMTNKIYLMGICNNLKEEIYKSSIFVLSSDYEGMPNALMEAMAMGIPCISTDCPCGGPRFLINDEYNGLLVPVNNKLALADAMQKLVDDSNLSKKIGINANKICEQLNPQKINDLWDSYIKEICKI